MSEAGDPDLKHRPIRSFVVVRGGRLTPAQQKALEGLWPRYGIEAGDGALDLPCSSDATRRVRWRSVSVMATTCSRWPAAHPEQDFMGVEVHPPGVGHLLHKAAGAGLTNLRVIQQDAVEVLERRLAPASLDSILVLFPDPWHKKRHHKRRLVSAAFANLSTTRLKPGGTLQLATDWSPYADWMLEVLNATPGLSNRATDGRFVPRNPGRVRTRFEARGERLGHAVHDLCFERISPSGG